VYFFMFKVLLFFLSFFNSIKKRLCWLPFRPRIASGMILLFPTPAVSVQHSIPEFHVLADLWRVEERPPDLRHVLARIHLPKTDQRLGRFLNLFPKPPERRAKPSVPRVTSVAGFSNEAKQQQSLSLVYLDSVISFQREYAAIAGFASVPLRPLIREPLRHHRPPDESVWASLPPRFVNWIQGFLVFLVFLF
jgi:hypothetical protein